ncbi:MAG: hypothetical protein ACFFB0_03530 [Promethearchaeota archaeon]
MKKIPENIDLKEIEKKTWRSTLQDGILDIYFGILILGIGMGMTLSHILPDPLDMISVAIFLGIGLTFFILGKNYITKPRLGFVKFGFQQKARKIKTIIILSINFFAILIINLIRFTNPDSILRFPGILDGLIIGLLFLTAPLFFVAYILQFPRLYFYAILFGISFFLSELFAIFIPEPLDTLITFSIISGVVIFVGVIFLIKFIRKYPIPKEEMTE